MNWCNLAGACALALGVIHCARKTDRVRAWHDVMAEYGAGTMNEAQVFYAPKYFLLAWARAISSSRATSIDRRREITYARVELPGEALEHGVRAGQRVHVGRRRAART